MNDQTEKTQTLISTAITLYLALFFFVTVICTSIVDVLNLPIPTSITNIFITAILIRKYCYGLENINKISIIIEKKKGQLIYWNNNITKKNHFSISLILCLVALMLFINTLSQYFFNEQTITKRMLDNINTPTHHTLAIEQPYKKTTDLFLIPKTSNNHFIYTSLTIDKQTEPSLLKEIVSIEITKFTNNQQSIFEKVHVKSNEHLKPPQNNKIFTNISNNIAINVFAPTTGIALLIFTIIRLRQIIPTIIATTSSITLSLFPFALKLLATLPMNPFITIT